MHTHNHKKAWIISVAMGYGHQRTAHALRGLAEGSRIINANDYPGIPPRDKKTWQRTRVMYEFVSRFRRVPLIGVALFLFMDSFQKILGYYPKRDLSHSTVGGRSMDKFIRRGWLKDLITRLKKHPAPLISMFPTPSQAAEFFNYPGDIYCVICDADVNRAWVALDARHSTIKYFASSTWSRDRLKLYGVPQQNILYTGYPLPKENIGRQMEIVKKDTAYRLLNLDPTGKYRQLYAPLIKKYVGTLPELPNHPLTIMFSIGGAGAQTEICVAIIKSLRKKIQSKAIRFIIAVGIRPELATYFKAYTKSLELEKQIQILYARNISEFFTRFNQALRTTDMLMTKPSELSFYAGLGIPIIIEPPLGSQEDFNQRWLLHTGAGVMQEKPKYTEEWLFDLLEAGDLAEMAMQGFVEIEKMGAYNIEKIIAQHQ